MKDQVKFPSVLIIVMAGLFLSSGVVCQTPSQPHAPNNPLPQWVLDNQRNRDDFERRSGTTTKANDLRKAKVTARSTARLPRDKVGVMTEAERKRIEALLEPNPEDLATYKEFLRQPRSGIFRLFPNANCVEKGVIRVDGDCANYVPGADSFKFRPGASTPDINFFNGKLSSFGFFSRYILAELGDVDIVRLAKSDSALDYLVNFVPGATMATARKQSLDFAIGVEVDGRRYSSFAQPEVNRTYGLRIIAYRVGNNTQKRALDALRNGTLDSSITFDSLRRDTRIDMLVVFRIIRRDDDGNLSIVWKEMERKASPKITFAKGEKWESF